MVNNCRGKREGREGKCVAGTRWASAIPQLMTALPLLRDPGQAQHGSRGPPASPYELFKSFLFFPQSSQVALLFCGASIYKKVNPVG